MDLTQGTAEEGTFLAGAEECSFHLSLGTASTHQRLKRLVPQWKETLDNKEQNT